MFLSIFFLFVLLTLFDYLYRKCGKEWRMVKKYPGDRAWPVFGNGLRLGFDMDGMSGKLKEMWKRHGKTNFRLSWGRTHSIIICEPDDVGVILNHRTELNKTDERNSVMIPFFGKSLSNSEGERWKFVRKALSPYFTYSTLDKRLYSVNKYGNKLLGNLDKLADEGPVDLYREIRPFMYDLFCWTLMGIESNLMDNMDHPYLIAGEKVVDILTTNYVSYWRNIKWLYELSPQFREQQRVSQELLKRSLEVLNARRQILKEMRQKIAENNQDVNLDIDATLKEQVRQEAYFLDELLLAKLPNGEPMPDSMILDELNLVSFTGHLITTKVLSHVMYLLSKHPHIQEKVLKEQKDIFEDNMAAIPTSADVSAMKYLSAVIKESMRVLPPITELGRKLQEDLVMSDGRTIPAGTAVIIYVDALYQHPKVYPDGEEFKPERFFEKTTPPYSYIPFSAGPRNCLGFKYAWVVVKATISNLIRRYEFLEAEPHLRPQIVHRMLTVSKNGMNLRLKRRLN